MVWENYGLNFTDEILWIPDSIAYRASWTKFQNTIQNQSGWWFQHVLKTITISCRIMIPKNTVSAKVKFSKIRPKSPSSSARSASSCGQPRDWVPWRRCDRTANLRTRGWRPSGHSWSNPNNHLGHGTPTSTMMLRKTTDPKKVLTSSNHSFFS